MADARLTQEIVEVFIVGNPPVNLTQAELETWRPGFPPVNTTQVMMEEWEYTAGGPPLNLTQNYVEVWYYTNTSGLYWINPTKFPSRDTYYISESKIPDPTIRTALIGE